MNRSSKATLAGGLAVVLLAGGATTFARWYSEQDLTDISVQSGELKLDTVPESDTWTINGENEYVSTTLIVPGGISRSLQARPFCWPRHHRRPGNPSLRDHVRAVQRYGTAPASRNPDRESLRPGGRELNLGHNGGSRQPF